MILLKGLFLSYSSAKYPVRTAIRTGYYIIYKNSADNTAEILLQFFRKVGVEVHHIQIVVVDEFQIGREQVHIFQAVLVPAHGVDTGAGRIAAHALHPGIITGAEVMDGIGVLSRFHKKESLMGEPLVGNSIYTFLDIAAGLDKKEWKRLQGYFRAFEALEVRLTDRELTREQEAYMETKRGKKGKKLR